MEREIEEFNEEKEDYIKELRSLQEGIDLDYFNLNTKEKKDLNKLLDFHITFLSNVGNKIYELKYELNKNKTNKKERKELEERANKLLLFFIEELEERTNKLDEEISKYLVE